MRIDQIPIQRYYNTQTPYCPMVHTAFGGEVGDKFVKGIKEGSLTDPEDIKNLMNNISRMGFISESQAEDIMESLVQYSKDLWADKLDLDKRWNNISDLEEFAAGCIINQAKAKYNIPSNEQTYDSNAEQVVLVTQFLNSIKDKLTNTTPSTQKDIWAALRNKDGVISNNDIEFIRRIIELREFCDVSLLPEVLRSVKDEKGNLDYEKAASFIAYSGYYPGTRESLSDAIDFVKKNSNLKVKFELNEALYNEMEVFIEKINKSGDISDLIKSLGLKKFGFIPASKIQGILNMITQFNQEHNKRAEYNVKRAGDTVDQDENKAKAESLIRAIYCKGDTGVTTYSTLGEQMFAVNLFLRGFNEKIKWVSNSETGEMVKVLQNSDGVITSKDINFLSKILNMVNGICDIPTIIEIYSHVKDIPEDELDYLGKVTRMCSLDRELKQLPEVIKLIKNKDGSLDLEKEAAFIGYYNGYKTSNDFSDSIDFVKRNFSSAISRSQKNNAQIESAKRVINDIEDSEVKTYNSLGEQINVVSKILWNKNEQLLRTSESTTESIVKALQNNEGIIADKDIDFLNKLLEFRKETESLLLPLAIKLVKDKDGNLDSEKVTAFFGYYGWENASLLSVLQTMNEEYNSNSPEMAQQIDNVAEIIEKDIAAKKAAAAAAAAAERQKVEALAQRFREGKNLWGRRDYSRVEIDSDGLISLRFSETGGVFFASVIGYDPDWVLQHVKSIDFADTVNLSGATSIGALRYIDADDVYWPPYDIDKAEVTGRIHNRQ